jgi:hypothetical protein
MLLSEGQISDYKCAALLIDAFPEARALLGDRGHDASWFRAALATRAIAACILSKNNRKKPIPHDALLCRQRHRIGHMLGKRGLGLCRAQTVMRMSVLATGPANIFLFGRCACMAEPAIGSSALANLPITEIGARSRCQLDTCGVSSPLRICALRGFR